MCADRNVCATKTGGAANAAPYVHNCWGDRCLGRPALSLDMELFVHYWSPSLTKNGVSGNRPGYLMNST